MPLSFYAMTRYFLFSECLDLSCEATQIFPRFLWANQCDAHLWSLLEMTQHIVICLSSWNSHIILKNAYLMSKSLLLKSKLPESKGTRMLSIIFFLHSQHQAWLLVKNRLQYVLHKDTDTLCRNKVKSWTGVEMWGDHQGLYVKIKSPKLKSNPEDIQA